MWGGTEREDKALCKGKSGEVRAPQGSCKMNASKTGVLLATHGVGWQELSGPTEASSHQINKWGQRTAEAWSSRYIQADVLLQATSQ